MVNPLFKSRESSHSPTSSFCFSAPSACTPLSYGLLVAGIGLSLVGCDVPDRPPGSLWRSEEPTWISNHRRDANSGASIDSHEAGLQGIMEAAESQRPSPGEGSSARESAPTQGTVATEWQTREVYYENRQPVGHATMRRGPDPDASQNGGTLTEVHTDRIFRDGPLTVVERIDHEIKRDADGRLTSITSRSRLGPLVATRIGRRIDGELEWETRLGGDTVRRQFPLPDNSEPALGGPLAIRLSLHDAPMSLGENREFSMLVPQRDGIAEVTLTAVGEAEVPVAGNKTKRLLEIEATIRVPPDRNSKTDAVQRTVALWADAQGVVWRAIADGGRAITLRQTEATFEEIRGDLKNAAWPMTLTVSGKSLGSKPIQQLGLEVCQDPKTVARLAGESADPASSLIRPAPCQYLQVERSTRTNCFRLIVANCEIPKQRLSGRFESFDSAVTPADTAATPLLDHGAAAISKLLRVSATGDDFTPRERLDSMMSTVHSLLASEPFSGGIGRASQIAGASVADSTEQAILLATLLRRENVPARLAFGFRRDPSAADRHTMKYHAWVIAHVDEGWIPIDPIDGEIAKPDRVTFAIEDMAEFDRASFFQRFRRLTASLPIAVYGVVH